MLGALHVQHSRALASVHRSRPTFRNYSQRSQAAGRVQGLVAHIGQLAKKLAQESLTS